jgi:hypothetical protein
MVSGGGFLVRGGGFMDRGGGFMDGGGAFKIRVWDAYLERERKVLELANTCLSIREFLRAGFQTMQALYVLKFKGIPVGWFSNILGYA